MLDYYAKRAPEYERIYTKPERQGDLAWLKARVLDVTRGARVLDLCAGTGALGLEALSRGAVFADLDAISAANPQQARTLAEEHLVQASSFMVSRLRDLAAQVGIGQ